MLNENANKAYSDYVAIIDKLGLSSDKSGGYKCGFLICMFFFQVITEEEMMSEIDKIDNCHDISKLN